MNEPALPTAAAALAAVYGNITAATGGLGEAALMTATRCAGWVAGDLLYHQLLDARRALTTFASPAVGPASADDVSYWRPYSPRSGEPAALGSAGHAAHARRVLDGLLGTAVPAGWTDRDYVLKGTGRVPLDDDDRGALGSLAGQFPLFG